jgi:hypothetical protein
MREYLNIGSTPSDEACAQVGSHDYSERSRAECKAFVAQLRRVFGTEPDGAVVTVKSFPHDFGSYREVVCYYDDGLPLSVEYAFKLERETPERWDDEARKELADYLNGDDPDMVF